MASEQAHSLVRRCRQVHILDGSSWTGSPHVLSLERGWRSRDPISLAIRGPAFEIEPHHEVLVDFFHPAANILRETCRAFFPISFSVAEAARQRFEFIGRFGREYKIRGVAANDAKAVNQITKEQVSVV